MHAPFYCQLLFTVTSGPYRLIDSRATVNVTGTDTPRAVLD